MGLFGFGKKKEQERQAELARQRELERQKELERQREEAKQAELAGQKELERQKELQKKKDAEAQELAKKQESVRAASIQNISDVISEYHGIAIVNYKGLTVQQDTDLRGFLREIKVNYKIFKNMYFRKALENTDFENLREYAEGTTAAALFNDPEQLGLLIFYCKTTEIGCSIEAASYRKNLLLPADLEKMMEDQVQKVREKYGDMIPEYVTAAAADTGSGGYKVEITNINGSKMPAIKIVKDLKGLGLKEAKDLVESIECTGTVEVLSDVDHDTAAEAVSLFQSADVDVRVIEPADSGASPEVQTAVDQPYDRHFLNLIARSEGEKINPDDLSLYLTDPGESLVPSTKLIREIMGLGLAESKELAVKARESRVFIKTFDDRDSLLEVKKRFDEVGAKTEIGSPDAVE